ncbi:MGMT family protein [Anaeromyxobacter paludicola]|uniref:Methylated-DNA-[protein]-cysteine S-methyltransferase DNA binding domain-containing protein n=1 Tax=Anaeromyxobacter paludicola TaxID=2918171 RepID=A0ABN6NBN5_9BACT|nr:MGMT family protein [Anaeromyxobacter paludicola]BDG10659.1 hypothetical protein AMPC_37720 [Anaeromyxobacter paludicola]
MPKASMPKGWERYYRIVRRVPRGRVTTFGAVAALAGQPRAARQVGYALSALKGTKHDVPWQRVLGKRSGDTAGVSLLDPMGAAVQRDLLEGEGVAFDERGRVALARFGWPGAARRRRAAPGLKATRRPARRRGRTPGARA